MPEQFLHGVEVVEIDTGSRPVRTVKSSVIGLIGTAPLADDAAFPLNTPVLVAGSRIEASRLGKTGTLPAAMDGIFDQIGAMVVVVRVEEGSGADKEAVTLAHVLGGMDSAGMEKKGCFHWIAGDESVVYLCEGFATGASLHMATGYAVVVAFDADNLLSVAKIVREQMPRTSLVIFSSQ